jgi:hypothetical protein
MGHVLPLIGMTEKSFTIEYNGKKVECLDMGDVFMVQVTYVPIYIQQIKDEDGRLRWIDRDEGRETNISMELGQLIMGHPRQ